MPFTAEPGQENALGGAADLGTQKLAARDGPVASVSPPISGALSCVIVKLANPLWLKVARP